MRIWTGASRYSACRKAAVRDIEKGWALLTQGIPIQIRVELNSGEVVVRTVGNDLHMDYSAIGKPHIVVIQQVPHGPVCKGRAGSRRLTSPTDEG